MPRLKGKPEVKNGMRKQPELKIPKEQDHGISEARSTYGTRQTGGMCGPVHECVHVYVREREKEGKETGILLC